ncbi:Deoxyguanosinetriphosphate triphosphohydrolase-like protein [Neochlamydia sp. TUME1]|nr:Deoxyguanosinetriphosphate triphosphohydrolase-like protein [Neochlamydia sp. TUME1]
MERLFSISYSSWVITQTTCFINYFSLRFTMRNFSKNECKYMTIPFSETLSFYRHALIKQEKAYLHPLAARTSTHSRQAGNEEDYRLPYKRDVDKIIHSRAYARYNDKTQVVYLVDNDHITHRGLHVQFVSSFARGIAEILRLNLDLVEAISLGHDVGHPPFGHEGEEYLSELSIMFENGAFAHPLQSCRLFTDIEPLNLGLAVYDGFLCHDGAMSSSLIHPSFDKTWEDHFNDKKQKAREPDYNIIPGTLEGCLVKLCDTMSYIGKDIEDAIRLGIISKEQVPKTFLGTTNQEILATLAKEIIKVSYEQAYIGISMEAFEALKFLRDFNFAHIYVHPQLKVESSKIKRAYRLLFELLLEDLNHLNEESYVWKNYTFNKNEHYKNSTSLVQMVVDYISGMTDSFFIRTLEKLTLPRRIDLRECFR